MHVYMYRVYVHARPGRCLCAYLYTCACISCSMYICTYSEVFMYIHVSRCVHADLHVHCVHICTYMYVSRHTDVCSVHTCAVGDLWARAERWQGAGGPAWGRRAGSVPSAPWVLVSGSSSRRAGAGQAEHWRGCSLERGFVSPSSGLKVWVCVRRGQAASTQPRRRITITWLGGGLCRWWSAPCSPKPALRALKRRRWRR